MPVGWRLWRCSLKSWRTPARPQEMQELTSILLSRPLNRPPPPLRSVPALCGSSRLPVEISSYVPPCFGESSQNVAAGQRAYSHRAHCPQVDAPSASPLGGGRKRVTQRRACDGVQGPSRRRRLASPPGPIFWRYRPVANWPEVIGHSAWKRTLQPSARRCVPMMWRTGSRAVGS